MEFPIRNPLSHLRISQRLGMGFGLLLPVFASALLGGIGKPYGAMAGGLIPTLTDLAEG